MSCERSFWEDLFYRCWPATKEDLAEMENRLSLAIGSANPKELQKLTSALAKSTSELEATVALHKPKPK